MTLEETATYNSNSLRRYVNLDEELRKVHIGQFRKKQRKAGDAANLPPLHSGGGGGAGSSKTLGRNYFSRIKGSDPRAATCRGKLQSKRSKLNMEINKELMLRSGAENLYKATTNKKLKETVALELSFVNSNLQLLKEQLAELNSSVELYQNEKRDAASIPMIPLGLKETKEIDFREPFKDFVLEHYSEDGHDYENAIAEFMDIRQAMRTPTRDANGIALLFEHFNQLYFVERRFFPPDRSLGIFFEWYDSLTGVPQCQRTVAFEKASVLFNIAALYTQIGTRQDRDSQKGLDSSVDNFLRSAGTFQYIHENFTNAPSMDLQPDTLEMLVHLMCAQARECLFEKAELHATMSNNDPVDRLESHLILGQEASHVSEVYHKLHGIISTEPVKDYVPYSWISLAQVKREHYKALAHFYVAVGLLEHEGEEFSTRAEELLQFLHVEDDEDEVDEGQRSSSSRAKNSSSNGSSANNNLIEIRVPKDEEERRYLGKAHLREALLLHEEAMRVNRMCRELRKKDVLQSVLRSTHDRSLNKYSEVDEEDDFQEVLDPPPIAAATQYQLSLAIPDLSRHKVQDLFSALGPVAVFNARHFWSAPRVVRLRKRESEGFGFSVRGDSPVVVAGVDHRSLAQGAGMKEGDYIVGINEEDVKWSPHDEVVALIKASANSLKLRVVTPMDGKPKASYLRSSSTSNLLRGSVSPTSTSSGSTSGLYSASTASSMATSGMTGRSHGQIASIASGTGNSGGESSSPASSVTSGSTRSNGREAKKAWGLFKKQPNNGKKSSLKDEYDSNVILR